MGESFDSRYAIESERGTGIVIVGGSEYFLSEMELTAIRGWNLERQDCGLNL